MQIGYAVTDLMYKVLSVHCLASLLADFDIFPRILRIVLFSFIAISLYAESVWVSVETSVQSWAFGAPFLSPLSYSAILFSAFLNTFFFLVMVPADECLAVLSSGGFEAG